MGKRIVGYCDPLSARPGDEVRFMVSSLDGEPFDARLVRLVCGDVTPEGHGFTEIEVDSAVDGRFDGVRQDLRPGSYAQVDAHPFLADLRSLSVDVHVWPTRRTDGPQTIVSSWDGGAGFALGLAPDGRAVATLGAGDGGPPTEVASDRPLPRRRWTRLSLAYDDAAGALTLAVETRPLSPGERLFAGRSEHTVAARARVATGRPLVFAARLDDDGRAHDHFNGRLDRCSLGAEAAGPAEVTWDFALDIGTDRIRDTGAHGLHGRTVQLPTRALPGAGWDGTRHSWVEAPDHYGAIHFHDDDLADAGWEPTCVLRVPDDLPSAVYALRVRTADSEDHLPFFVLPGADHPPADIAFLAPTVTYRAYANIKLTLSPDRVFGSRARAEVDNDRFLIDHPECGPGHYDHHTDGSGVVFSSHLRPVMNLKPKGGLWSFTADTNVVAWLEETGLDHHVVTDDALHAEGVDLLSRYRVIVTGTHPEYWTTPMLDALEAYLERGGRLLYLGGNGFYWRAAFHPSARASLEVRRAEDGTRFWIAEPGEYVHEATGELGGLWRRLGRPPNRVAGVGFAAQGFGASGHYRRQPGWDDERVAFATEGLADREVLGDHGTIGGGAAGHEIDRFDLRLGSPAHAVVLASSEGLPADMLRTKEEHFATGFPDRGSEVRADLVFFEVPNGGAVFSVGSIAWAASLATNGYDNDVARLTTNVLRRFADPAPIPPPPDATPG